MQSEKVDLAIIDNNIVDNSPEQVIAAIRSDARYSGVPIIMLSSRAFVFDIEKFLKLGVDRCLSKPLELKTLGLICKELIESRRNPKDAQAKQGDKKPHIPRSRVIMVDDIFH